MFIHKLQIIIYRVKSIYVQKEIITNKMCSKFKKADNIIFLPHIFTFDQIISQPASYKYSSRPILHYFVYPQTSRQHFITYRTLGNNNTNNHDKKATTIIYFLNSIRINEKKVFVATDRLRQPKIESNLNSRTVQFDCSAVLVYA